MGKKGQVTIFVIIAILVVVAGILIYTLDDSFREEPIPTSIEPVKTAFMDCVEAKTSLAVSLLESNGGYIESPEFVPGTRYQPFSSKLKLGGLRIPYWFYTSGSSLEKTQVPTVEFMEDQISRFIERESLECDFDLFEEEGFHVKSGKPIAEVKIDDDFVQVDLNMDLSVEKGMESAILKDHNLRVNTNLGSLYEAAKEIYDREQSEYFLEKYSVDVVRLYAPVDGVELTCSPMVWNADQIYENISEGLEVNIGSLNNKGRRDDYYTVDLDTDYSTRFYYSKDWPTYMEINPTDGNMLVAKPVGNQQGMGVLGFCYVPYHFVYNLRHPVLVQVTEGGEMFQFPMVVLIEGNLAREGKAGQSTAGKTEDVCEFANTKTKVSIYDGDLKPVDGVVSFSCVDSSCNLGNSANGELEALFPQCVNGVLEVSAEGYKDEEIIYSSMQEGNPILILEKEYNQDISLIIGGKEYTGEGMISISSEDVSETIILGEENNIDISQGEYDIQVHLYKSSELKLPASTQEHCVRVPRTGILGLAGLTKNDCTEVEVPEQLVTNALIGGGSGKYIFSEDELKNSNRIVITADAMNEPTSLEELQNNYILMDTNELGVTLA